VEEVEVEEDGRELSLICVEDVIVAMVASDVSDLVRKDLRDGASSIS